MKKLLVFLVILGSFAALADIQPELNPATKVKIIRDYKHITDTKVASVDENTAPFVANWLSKNYGNSMGKLLMKYRVDEMNLISVGADNCRKRKNAYICDITLIYDEQINLGY